MGAEQCEIHTPPVEGGTQRVGRAGPDPGAACDLEHLLISDGTRFAHGGPAWFPVQTRPPDDRSRQSYSVPRNRAAPAAFSGAACVLQPYVSRSARKCSWPFSTRPSSWRQRGGETNPTGGLVSPDYRRSDALIATIGSSRHAGGARPAGKGVGYDRPTHARRVALTPYVWTSSCLSRLRTLASRRTTESCRPACVNTPSLRAVAACSSDPKTPEGAAQAVATDRPLDAAGWRPARCQPARRR